LIEAGLVPKRHICSHYRIPHRISFPESPQNEELLEAKGLPNAVPMELKLPLYSSMLIQRDNHGRFDDPEILRSVPENLPAGLSPVGPGRTKGALRETVKQGGNRLE
jgi:hypothetical protein